MKFKEYWDLIEEGIRLINSRHVILDIDNDDPYDVCYTSRDNSCFCINVSSTVTTDPLGIVDSIYAPYIIYDDKKATYFDYDKISKMYVPSKRETKKAGNYITTPIYHSFKNDLINTSSGKVSDQLDSNFKKTTTYSYNFKKLKKLDYNDVNKFILRAASNYAYIVNKYLKNIKFNSIQYPDSKSKHVENISQIIQSKLKLSNPQKLIKHNSDKLVNKFFDETKVPNIFNIYKDTVNTLNAATTILDYRELAKSAFDTLVKNYNKYKSEIDTCFNNISYDPKYRIDQKSKARKNHTKIPRVDIYKIYLIASWITVLSTRCCNNSNKYAQISSANDVRKTAINLHGLYNTTTYKNKDQYNTARSVDPNELNAVDTYSYGYYDEGSISEIQVDKQNKEINLLLVDDNINLGSTIFTLTHQIKAHFSKLYNGYTIKCHWFVLFMPIMDYNKIYSKQSSEILKKPILDPIVINANKTVSNATSTTTPPPTDEDIKKTVNELTKTCKNFNNIVDDFKDADYTFIKDHIAMGNQIASERDTATEKQFAKRKRISTSYLPTDTQRIHRPDRFKVSYISSLSKPTKKTLQKTIPTLKQLMFLDETVNGKITGILCRIINFNPNVPPTTPKEKVKNYLKQQSKKIDKKFVKNLTNFYEKRDHKNCYNLILNQIESIINNIEQHVTHHKKGLVKQLSMIYVLCKYYSDNIHLIRQYCINNIAKHTHKSSNLKFFKYFLMFNLLSPVLIANYENNCSVYNNLLHLQINSADNTCEIVDSNTSNINTANPRDILDRNDYKYICNMSNINYKKVFNTKDLFEEKRNNYTNPSTKVINDIQIKCTNILNRKFISNLSPEKMEQIKTNKQTAALASTIEQINNKSVCDVFVHLFETTTLKPTKRLLAIMKLSTNQEHKDVADRLEIKYF